MKPSIIAAIVFVIGSGIAGSYFILKNPLLSASTNTTSPNSGENATAQASGKIPINWISKIGDTIANIASSSFSDTSLGLEPQTSALPSTNNSSNLTEAVAQTIFSRMKTQDQAGNQPFQSFDPNNPSDQALLSEATQGLDPSSAFLGKIISDTDLKILSDNSKEAKVRYLETIQSITQTRFADARYKRSSDEIIADIQTDCFGTGSQSMNQPVADLYKNLIQDYFNLKVPSDWVAPHKDILNYFSSANAVYQSFASCSQDPVKAYMATQALPKLMTEGQITQKAITGEAKSIGLQ